ncbi:MAG TPA: substrate-binding domain-containing protein [Thermoanaerobaculia bacterium]
MKKFLVALALVTMTHSVAYAAGWKVIVNTANPTDSLTKKELASIFMKKTAKWEHGTPVVPVDQNDKSAARAGFTTDVHGKSVSAVKSYWQQQIFSGRDVPPVEKASDAQAIAFVKANAGAIAYVSDTADATGTKTLVVK